MAASDAAPLPRLGEVFFDVRGESRSMRLSWYADTGVAVFSIWQGGTCTGTFRLPIADLPRMVVALQRGPRGRDPGTTGEQAPAREMHGHGPGRMARPGLLDSDIETGQTMAARRVPPAPADPDDYPGDPREPGYRAGRRGRGHRGDPLEPGYRDEPLESGYRDEPLEPGYRDDPPEAGYRGAYSAPRHLSEPPGGFLPEPLVPGYRPEPGDGYQDAGYQDAGYQDEAPTGLYPSSRVAGGYPGGEYPDRPVPGDYPTGPDPGEHPWEESFQPHPEEPDDRRYGSPARPYVSGTDEEESSAEGPGDGPRRRADRQAGRSPGSFPYGPPPGNRERW